MGSALLFIVGSRLLVYSAGSGVNSLQVVLSGICKRLFCFVQAKTLCRYGCMCFLASLVLVCVEVIVMSSAYTMTCTGALGGGKSKVYMLNSVGERTPPCGRQF